MAQFMKHIPSWSRLNGKLQRTEQESFTLHKGPLSTAELVLESVDLCRWSKKSARSNGSNSRRGFNSQDLMRQTSVVVYVLWPGYELGSYGIQVWRVIAKLNWICAQWHEKIIMNAECVRIRKTVVDYLKVLHRNSSGETEENHQYYQ
jgi:hypothetical protein